MVTVSEDLIIIGGGPAGCAAAIYAARARLHTLVLDRGIAAGALGRAERVDNYPGLPRIGGADLVAAMQKQAASFGAHFARERVTAVNLAGEWKQVYAGGKSYTARALIIATGSMERVATVPGEERLSGRGVSYCATCDGAFFRGKRVAVVGDDEEALREARHLARFVVELYLITRKEQLPGTPPEQATVVAGAVLQKITGVSAVTGIVIRRGEKEEMIPVDGVFIYLHGNRPVTGFLAGALPTDDFGCLKVDAQMQTAVPGVFAAGDVLCPEIKQAVVAAAEGSRAAMQALHYLGGRAVVAPAGG